MKKYLIISVCFILNYTYSQDIPNDAYGIIPLVMSQDTIVPDYVKRSVKYRVINGKMTEKEGVSYIEHIKSRKLTLKEVTSNEVAKKTLTTKYLDKTGINKYITDNQIFKIRENIPVNSVFDKTKIEPKIKFINDTIAERCHSFSLPLLVKENQYLIYHTVIYGTSIKTIEFILYDINIKGECELIDDFKIWQH